MGKHMSMYVAHSPMSNSPAAAYLCGHNKTTKSRANLINSFHICLLKNECYSGKYTYSEAHTDMKQFSKLTQA